MNLTAVINFCSNDYPFLRHAVDALRPLFSQIVIPVCDHFFDGKPEDRQTLDRIYAENPDVQFIEFPFTGVYPSVYWHNLARMIGTFFVEDQARYVLFLDCDEIADTDRLARWLQVFDIGGYEAIRFSNYWYFRTSSLQATTWENSPLLVRKEILNGEMIMNPRERHGIFDSIAGQKIDRVDGLDEKPLFHHYSWVRTKEQLMRKVVSWSHNADRNWASRVEEEFSREFNGTDFVHGYAFQEVKPFADIDLSKRPKEFSSCDFSHVRKLSPQEVARIDISLTYRLPCPPDLAADPPHVRGSPRAR